VLCENTSARVNVDDILAMLSKFGGPSRWNRGEGF
jgi:hypothetical protein